MALLTSQQGHLKRSGSERCLDLCGLGMKVVQALAQQLGGKLRIDVTERSEGTTFSVQFGDHRLDQRSVR